MFRVTQLIKELFEPTPVRAHRDPPGPVVIWNLIRRCNLACKHCYAGSTDKDFSGELSTDEVFATMTDLRAFRVPVLILSGGEPLLRDDIFEISKKARDLGFYVALSSNGTMITKDNIRDIAAIGYDYVGVSLDGIGETNDYFRQKDGAFEEALNGIRLCHDAGAKVGLRFTLTNDNAHELPKMLDLREAEAVDKFYLSHLNYAGRGNANRDDDAYFKATRATMTEIFERVLGYVEKLGDDAPEFTTGNNDADGVFMYHWVRERFPDKADHILGKLRQWGGNATGVNVANIDNRGFVHPDTMWWHHTLGNVRERPFSEMWTDLSDPILAGLKDRPRKVSGRCAACGFLEVCNGNTRVRAQRLTGDPWSEDPGCYLSDVEIDLAN